MSECKVTPEEIFLNRRSFLFHLSGVTINFLAFFAVPPLFSRTNAWASQLAKSSRLKVSPKYLATGYNNFYEFSGNPTKISSLTQKLDTSNWTVRVKGLIEKPRVLDWDKLIRKFPTEERVYKLRCVETWTVTIPWIGFPLKTLIKELNPLSSARYVVFRTFINTNIAQGQKKRFWEPWPYTEGLRLDEALNDLSFLATGMYGKDLPPQNGAPVRLVVPWKYGFKSVKAISEIEFTRNPPATFWQTMAPLEYDFWANVIPDYPYARWDQSFEYALGENQKTRTELFNGYASQVADLYS